MTGWNRNLVQFKYVFGLSILIIVLISGCVNSNEQPQKKSISPYPPAKTINNLTQDPDENVKILKSRLIGIWDGVEGTPSDNMTFVFNKDGTCYLNISHQESNGYSSTEYPFKSCKVGATYSPNSEMPLDAEYGLALFDSNNHPWSLRIIDMATDYIVINIIENEFKKKIGLGNEVWILNFVNQRSSMSSTEFYDIFLSKDLTTIQKEYLYINKIFSWTGKVTDVTKDTVEIENEYCRGEGINRLCHQMNVKLHVNDDQMQELISLSKGSIISFEGKITEKIDTYNYGNIDMYNGKIIN